MKHWHRHSLQPKHGVLAEVIQGTALFVSPNTRFGPSFQIAAGQKYPLSDKTRFVEMGSNVWTDCGLQERFLMDFGSRFYVSGLLIGTRTVAFMGIRTRH